MGVRCYPRPERYAGVPDQQHNGDSLTKVMLSPLFLVCGKSDFRPVLKFKAEEKSCL